VESTKRLKCCRHNSRPSKSRIRDGPEMTKRRPRHSPHLSKVFEFHPREINTKEENKLLLDINTPKMIALARPFTAKEVRATIRVLNPRKAPGYDLITNQVLQKLPDKGIRFITQLYNAVFRQGFFPLQWKVTQITYA